MIKKKNSIKLEKLTDHVTYRIINDTIYLFQNIFDITNEEFKIVYKRLSLLIEDNDISYINISAERMQDRKEFYQKLGFSLSYYDAQKLNMLHADKKNKSLYKCYGLMTKKDFLSMLKEEDVEVIQNDRKIITSNDGYVSSLLLLFGGIILLCYFCVNGAIYLVR